MSHQHTWRFHLFFCVVCHCVYVDIVCLFSLWGMSLIVLRFSYTVPSKNTGTAKLICLCLPYAPASPWLIDITKCFVSSLDIFCQTFAIDSFSCFRDFLPSISSSAGEKHVRFFPLIKLSVICQAKRQQKNSFCCYHHELQHHYRCVSLFQKQRHKVKSWYSLQHASQMSFYGLYQ